MDNCFFFDDDDDDDDEDVLVDVGFIIILEPDIIGIGSGAIFDQAAAEAEEEERTAEYNIIAIDSSD